jgi:cell division septum initiation protein DivIVA
MPYTPVELRHVRVARSFFGGYRRNAVQELLEGVADSFEDVWRDRGELTDKVHTLETQLSGLKQREELLTNTLVAAEQAAVEVRDHARREADLILSEAHQEARSVMRAAQAERSRLFSESRRVEALLRAALGMVEESGVEPPKESAAEAPEPEAESWPKRDDTREFNLNVVPNSVPVDQEAQAG